MGTRADFYLGEDTDLQWLGSVAWDGYPDGFEGESYENPLTASNQEEYLQRIQKMLDTRDDATKAEDGWPWPWKTSHTTDYAYSFFNGTTAGSSGHGWWTPATNDPGTYPAEMSKEEGEARADAYYNQPKQNFPDMSSQKNFVLDSKKSGIIVFEY